MPCGNGKHTYVLVDGWAKLPAGWSFLDVVDVAIDYSNYITRTTLLVDAGLSATMRSWASAPKYSKAEGV